MRKEWVCDLEEINIQLFCNTFSVVFLLFLCFSASRILEFLESKINNDWRHSTIRKNLNNSSWNPSNWNRQISTLLLWNLGETMNRYFISALNGNLCWMKTFLQIIEKNYYNIPLKRNYEGRQCFYFHACTIKMKSTAAREKNLR